MARAFPERSPQAIARLAVAEARFQLRQRLERLVFPGLDRAWARNHVPVEGLGTLQEAVGAGRPVLLIAAHLGTHGLPPVLLHRLGVPVQVRTFQLPDTELEGGRGWAQARRRRMEDALGVRFLRAGTPDDAPARVLAAGGVLLTTGDGLGPGRICGEPQRRGALGATDIAWPAGPYPLGAHTDALALGVLLDDRPQGPLLRLLPLGTAAPFQVFRAAYEALWRLRPETWQFWDELGALEAGRGHEGP